jgi:flagellar basal body-associated protein FliL
MSKRNWILVTIGILLLIIILIVIYLFTSNKFKFKPAFTETNTISTVFNNYDMETTKFEDKNAVKIKNIVASTADNNNTFFKIDLTVVTSDKDTAKKLINSHKKTYLIISTTLSGFKASDVQSIKGKKFLKNKLKRELGKKYGHEKIEAIYFENFIIS